MPDLDGMAVLERAARHALDVPTIVQIAANGVDAAGSALRAGAVDFLVKPASPERVGASLANALRLGALKSEVLRAQRGRADTPDLDDLILDSPAMERVRVFAERAARSSVPILIEGEPGTGKERLARAIHAASVRRSRPFTIVHCGRLGAGDIGAFLAGEGRGRGPDAQGGTLFLDEVAALSAEAQRLLEQHLGGAGGAGANGSQRPARGAVRVIAASSRRLIDAVSSGFSDALFYRLSVAPIWLPPLRQRRGDLPSLARTALARLAAEAGRSHITAIAEDAISLLVAHDGPGNLRELRTVLLRAVMRCEGSAVERDDLPPLGVADEAGIGSAPAGHLPASAFLPGLADVAMGKQMAAERQHIGDRRPDSPTSPRYGSVRCVDEYGDLRPFDALEEDAIRFAIGFCGGRMSEVARRLGIGRSTLYRKIRDYGIASGGALTR
jgi:DNA-binding NtrC family response regulator